MSHRHHAHGLLPGMAVAAVSSRPRGSPAASAIALLTGLLKSPVATKAQKAFLYMYIYVSLSRIVGDVTSGVRQNRPASEIFARALRSLRRGLDADKLPRFLARLVLLYPISEYLLARLLRAALPGDRHDKRQRAGPLRVATVFAAGLVSSYCAHAAYIRAVVRKSPSREVACARLDNISSEVTALVVSRAADTLLRRALRTRLKSSPLLAQVYDVSQFTLSCFVIMFSWFFRPQHMQQKYRQWITKMANMDSALVEALRLIREKKLIYGVAGPHSAMLEPMATRFGMPPEKGNTAKTVPIPCKLVHANSFDNCEMHALWRFARGVKTASMVYLPLNIVLALRRRREPLASQIVGITTRTARSSAFLAAFIALNWYMVCLVRTRLGPRLFPRATAQQLDDTWGPALGSFMCGFSVLLEETKRRSELALFVFAKAASIVLPSDMGSSRRTLDSALFSASLAVLITFAKTDPASISGFFGYFIQGMY